MAQLGPPMLWPLLWVVITLATMFNPLQASPSVTCCTPYPTMPGHTECHVGGHSLVDDQESS